MKTMIGIPARTYYIAYRGVVIHIENNMLDALSRFPRRTDGWKITYVFETDPAGTSPREAWPGPIREEMAA